MQIIPNDHLVDRPITKNTSIVSRKIHDAFFLINITDNYAQNKCTLYEINEIGNFIWGHINGSHSIYDIALALQQVITDEVDFQILLDDVTQFVYTLLNEGFVEV